MTKTLEEINELKAQWKNDPIWEIEDTEGFEEHKEELELYSRNMKMYWRETNFLKKINECGVNLTFLNKVRMGLYSTLENFDSDNIREYLHEEDAVYLQTCRQNIERALTYLGFYDNHIDGIRQKHKIKH